MLAAEDCRTAVMPAPISTPRIGLLMDAIAFWKPSHVRSGSIAPDMVFMPMNRMPKPIVMVPNCLAVLYLSGRFERISPRNVKMAAKSICTDSSSDVTVVPMFAPIITPTACVRDISPALTKPTTMTVVAEEDCTTAVMVMPASMARKRLPVTMPSSFFSRVPAAFSSASPISCIPNRNSPSPPNRDKTFIIVMMVRFLRACRNAAKFRLCGEKSHTYLLYHTLRLFSTEFYRFIEISGGVQRENKKPPRKAANVKFAADAAGQINILRGIIPAPDAPYGKTSLLR